MTSMTPTRRYLSTEVQVDLLRSRLDTVHKTLKRVQQENAVLEKEKELLRKSLVTSRHQREAEEYFYSDHSLRDLDDPEKQRFIQEYIGLAQLLEKTPMLLGLSVKERAVVAHHRVKNNRCRFPSVDEEEEEEDEEEDNKEEKDENNTKKRKVQTEEEDDE